MKAFAHHFSFEFRTGIRNKNLLLMNYLFPLGFFLLMGFVMPALNPFFLERMIPAMTIFAAMAATLLGLPDPLIKARETGILRSYRINGVPAISILVIPALTTMVHLAIVTAIVTVVSPLLFGAPLPRDWAAFIIVFGAIWLASAGLSVLIGVTSSSSRITVLWTQIFFIPSMLLGGLMIPLDMLPGFASAIGQLLPATHGMNAFAALAYSGVAVVAPWGSAVVLVSGGVLAFILAIYLFDWDRRNKTRRGHPSLAFLAMLPYVAGIVLL